MKRNRRKTSRGALLVLLALAVAIAIIASCERHQEVVVDRPGPDRKVEIQRGPQSTEVEFHNAEAERHLNQAGEHLGQGARELGAAVAQGAQSVGKQIGPAAREAGQQLQQGARDLGHEVKEKVGPALSDAAITASIKAKLLADSDLKGTSIDVTTDGGEVTLSGRASTPGQKAKAEKVAVETTGVRRVVNNVGVGG
ncbi:MAG TPA: BON domain-containing protein [Thermoanaerobaculia bacterium]|nr:BON domain-containing protein [Thermoanaerobaculia bacterium]